MEALKFGDRILINPGLDDDTIHPDSYLARDNRDVGIVIEIDTDCNGVTQYGINFPSLPYVTYWTNTDYLIPAISLRLVDKHG